MALTTEQIDAAYRVVWTTVPHRNRLSAFAHHIEAEVRKDDEALIRQLLEALEQVAPHVDQLVCYGSTAAEWPLNTAPRNVQSAIAAARAHLEKAP